MPRLKLQVIAVQFSIYGRYVCSIFGGLLVRRIIQANIDRFKKLLETETDATRRAMEARLLAEEEAKLIGLLDAEKKTKAF